MDYKEGSAWKVVSLVFLLIIFIGGTALVSAQTLSSSSSISITALVIDPSAGGGSSGGGGASGGSGWISSLFGSFNNQAIFRGLAYPGSIVTLLQSGVIVGQVTAGPDGLFEIALLSLSPGSYNFAVRSDDGGGRHSILQMYSVMVTAGVSTIISGIFLPPTIGISKNQVMRGDIITFFGTSAPNAKVTTVIHSASEIVKTINADLLGRWIYKFDTLPLENGIHEVRARAANAYDITPFSQAVPFRVGPGPAPRAPILNNTDLGRFDLNGDRRVNIKDFSILVYWFRRSAPPSKVDLNGDNKVDLSDFSILAYHWTG